ncbi:unnamed protein product [Pedinophyceae sp. YPF-701]|nr:unnamed protein product [Pedinophyceae sp. YPF-701]
MEASDAEGAAAGGQTAGGASEAAEGAGPSQARPDPAAESDSASSSGYSTPRELFYPPEPPEVDDLGPAAAALWIVQYANECMERQAKYYGTWNMAEHMGPMEHVRALGPKYERPPRPGRSGKRRATRAEAIARKLMRQMEEEERVRDEMPTGAPQGCSDGGEGRDEEPARGAGGLGPERASGREDTSGARPT